MRKNVKSILVVMMVIMGTACFATQAIAAAPGTYGGAPEKIVTGKVTECLRIVADDGKEYAPIGAKTSELIDNIGQRVEIRGHLLQQSGGRLIDVQEITVKEEMKR